MCTFFIPSHQRCNQSKVQTSILRDIPRTFGTTIIQSDSYFRCYALYLYREISGPLELFD